MLGDPDVYSMHDLIDIKNGELKTRLNYLVEVCCRHTAECQVNKINPVYCKMTMTSQSAF